MQTNIHSVRQTSKQAFSQVARQTGRLASTHADVGKQTGRHTDRQGSIQTYVGRQTYRDRQGSIHTYAGRQTDRQGCIQTYVGRQVDIQTYRQRDGPGGIQTYVCRQTCRYTDTPIGIRQRGKQRNRHRQVDTGHASTSKKGHQRLHLLRKLRSLNAGPTVLRLFYSPFI